MSIPGDDFEDVLDRVFEKSMTSAEVSRVYRFYCEMIYRSILNGELPHVLKSLESILGPDKVEQINSIRPAGDFH